MAIIASIGAFLPGLFGKDLAFKTARALGFGIIGILIVLALWGGGCAIKRNIINDHDAKREAAASGARETSANERVKDGIADAKNEKELHDAIESAPSGGSVSPAARALNCERLHRQSGRLPAGC